MSGPKKSPAKRPFRSSVSTIKAAATPLAVAGVVAISASGFSASPAAAAADQVQQRLVHEGYLAPDQVSGVFDTRTGAAVARWQAARGLRADGLVDSTTADVLLGNPSPQSPHRRIPQ